MLPSVGAVGDWFVEGGGERGNFSPVGRFGVGPGWMRERGVLGEFLFVALCDKGGHGPLGQAGECILVLQILAVLTELSL